METTQLRYFVAVARAGSLTAASAELKVTQPTLSVAVQRLETRLGTVLFHRGRDGMTLTATGRELLTHATDALAVLGRAEERVRALEHDESGRVVLGCSSGLGSYFLPMMLACFVETFSRLELDLVNSCSAEVIKAVIGRRVDLGVVVNPKPHPELVLVELYHDRHELFVGPEGVPGVAAEAAERVRRSPVLYVDCPESLDLLAALRGRALLSGRQLACGSLSMVRTLTSTHVGIGILPRRYAETWDPEVVVALGHNLPTVEDAVQLVYRADVPRTKATLRIESALVAQGKRLARS